VTTFSLPRRPGLKAVLVAVFTGASITLVGPVSVAEASICFPGGRQPSLRVNAAGSAEVGWLTAQGVRHYAVVTPRGRVLWGQRMAGRDVSVQTKAVRIPLKRVLKRTPDGTFWALQSWRRKCSRAELRFSRWKGVPTKLTAATVCCVAGGERLRGRVTFHQRPVYRARVYLDCFACPLRPSGWARFAVRSTRQDGSYSVRIRAAWAGRRYRATAVGPNFGWTRAPDARVVVPSALP
jgi:hypothetical protein